MTRSAPEAGGRTVPEAEERTVPEIEERISRRGLLSASLKVVAAALGGATVCLAGCLLLLLLIGGGTAAVADGIVRESLTVAALGLVAATVGVGYLVTRRVRAHRRHQR